MGLSFVVGLTNGKVPRLPVRWFTIDNRPRKLSASFAATDSSMREKSFMGRGEKLERAVRFCNRMKRARLMNRAELKPSQPGETFVPSREKFSLDKHARVTPGPMGRRAVIYTGNFDAEAGRLERVFDAGDKNSGVCGSSSSQREGVAPGCLAVSRGEPWPGVEEAR